MSGFNASDGKAINFLKKLFYCGGDGNEYVQEERERAFLDAFVKFVEADFHPHFHEDKFLFMNPAAFDIRDRVFFNTLLSVFSVVMFTPPQYRVCETQ